jgi:serine/threonine-protein kinase
MLDFGVAKANQRVHSTQGKQLKGKFRYMAPEQVLGGAVDRRTDVFAAGVILWRLLTGRHLFGGSAEPAAILNNVLHLPIEKPSMLVSGIPAELDAVTLKALERDPDRRFSSALELALALQKAIRLPPTHEIGRYIENVCAESLATRTAQLAEIARARGASTGAVSEQDQKPPPTVRLSGSAADHEGMTGTRPVQARRDDQEEWRTERVTGGGWLAQHALDDRSAGKESQKPRRRLSLAVASAALTLGAAGLYLLSLEQSPASSPLGSPHPPVVAVAAPSPPVTVLEPTPALALDEEQRPAAEETPTEETAAAKPAEAKPRAARRPPRSKPPAPTSSAARPKEPAPPVVDPLSRRK